MGGSSSCARRGCRGRLPWRSGTVLGALAAGIPLVVVPVFADQLENGRRTAAAGAGHVVEQGPASTEGARRSIDDRDAPRIRAAIEAVLTDPGFVDHARVIAREMASAPTVDEVLLSCRVTSRPPDGAEATSPAPFPSELQPGAARHIFRRGGA